MNTKITEKEFKSQRGFYRLLKKNRGLKWLDINYRSEKKQCPLEAYTNWKISFFLFHFFLGVILAFAIIGVFSSIKEIVLSSWDFSLQALFSCIVFLGAFFFIISFLFLMRSMLDIVINANWNMKSFKPDVEALLNRANISGEWIEWLSANGLEITTRVVPLHVKETFKELLLVKAKSVKRFDDPDRVKRHDDDTILELEKKECKEFFDLCKRFNIMSSDSEIRVLYSNAEQELKNEKEANRATSHPG